MTGTTIVHPDRGTLIGRADGLLVYVTARIVPVDKPESFRTIDHGPVPAGAMRLSIQGEVWRPRARLEPDSCGQITDTVRRIRPRLADLWDRWHLNDMRAECAHMDLPADRSYDARKGIVCPTTGYRYGSAWLFESLPTDIADQLRSFGIEPHIG